jgi:AcrR family transcriptional regulator
MFSGDFLRARQPEQKEQRRAAILDAAERLLAEHPVDEITLTAIADRVGLAKSNVYRYFESREQIFLTIFLAHLVAWVDDVGRGLEPFAGHGGASTVAEVITAAFVSRPMLCELSSVRERVLELNVSEATVLAVRTASDRALLEVASWLYRTVPSVPRDRCEWAIRTVFAVVAGLWPLTRRSPAADGCGSGPRGVHASFADDLERSVRALLYGLHVEAWRASGRRVEPTAS